MFFGFISKEERDFFIQILNIKGIGSQISMSLLNKFSLKQLFNAIINSVLLNSIGMGHHLLRSV